jgi:hypothetical protein
MEWEGAVSGQRPSTSVILGRLAAIVAIVVGLVASIASTPASTAEALVLDLAAMHLFPADLDAAGFPGYGLYPNGGTDFPEAVAAAFATDETGTDDLLAEYDRLGFRRAHGMKLSLPTEPNDPHSPERRYVNTWVAEFAQAGPNMDEAWDLFQGMYGGEVIAEAPMIGEESRVSRASMPYDDAGVTLKTVTVTFRIDRVFAGVVFADLEGRWPLVDQAENLAGQLVPRIEDGLNSDTANLSRYALYAQGGTSYDRYLKMNDDPVRTYGDDPNTVSPREGFFAAAADACHNEWNVPPGEAGEGDDFAVIDDVMRFGDEATATKRVDHAAKALPTTDLPEIQEVEVPEFGDQQFGVTYFSPKDATQAVDKYVRLVHVRVGNLIAQIWIVDVRPIPAAAADELVRAQADCLAGGGCVGRVPVPAAFTGWSTTSDESARVGEAGAVEPSGGDLRTSIDGTGHRPDGPARSFGMGPNMRGCPVPATPSAWRAPAGSAFRNRGRQPRLGGPRSAPFGSSSGRPGRSKRRPVRCRSTFAPPRRTPAARRRRSRRWPCL